MLRKPIGYYQSSVTTKAQVLPKRLAQPVQNAPQRYTTQFSGFYFYKTITEYPQFQNCQHSTLHLYKVKIVALVKFFVN